MRIIFHQSASAGNKSGVGHYASRLLEALHKLPEHADIDCFPSGWVWSAYQTWVRYAVPSDRQTSRKQGSSRLRLRAPFKLASRVARAGLTYCLRKMLDRQCQAAFAGSRYDLYHEPNFLPLQTDLPTVVTVHDLSVLLHPEWHPAQRVKLFERDFHRGLRQCRHVITGSQTVREEVIRVLHMPPERVTRVYYGVHPHVGPLPPEQTERMLRRLQLRPGYLLYLGTIEPRKNILMLMQAYCALPPALRERCPLLVVGGWGWKSEATRAFYESEGRHRGVQCLGYVHDRYLPAIYNGARALVYPSFYEGFGLPCMEMMACGGAVLASTADVFVETLGKQACLIPAGDADGWRAAMARVIEEEDWRQSLRHGTTGLARAYTWENTAAETLGVYRRVCAGESSAGPAAKVA